MKPDTKQCLFCPISLAQCEGPCVFADILNNISVGMIGFDLRDRRILYLNRLARDVLMETIGSVDYREVVAVLYEGASDPDDARAPTGVPRTIRRGERFIGFTSYRMSDRHYWLYLLDITERLRLASVAEAANIAENTGFVFAGIRHELGNPVNSIKMALHVLRRNLHRFDRETVVEYIDRALGEVERAEYLLKALRNFNLFERPRLRLVRVGSFLEKFLPLVEPDLQRRGIGVVPPSDGRDLVVRIDPRALQQVLLNLLANAADALSDRPDPRVEFAVAARGSRVVFAVIDNGHGISPERLADLFKPFRTTKPQGTGLGLVIVKKMMAQMEGSVEVESRAGEGTRVLLDLMRGENPGE